MYFLLDHSQLQDDLELFRLDNREIVVFVPTRWVSFHPVELKKASNAMVRKALPELLRETLLDDVADMAFSFLRRDESVVDVLAYHSSCLSEVVEKMQSMGIKYFNVLPDFYRIPLSDNRVTWADIDDQRIFRIDAHQALAVPIEQADAYTQLLSVNHSIDSSPSALLPLGEVAELKSADPAISLYCLEKNEAADFWSSLAPFKVALSKSAAVVALLSIALMAMSLGLEDKAQKYESELVSFYEKLNRTKVSEGQLALMERRLSNKMASANELSLMTALKKINFLVAKSQVIKLASIRYENNQLLVAAKAGGDVLLQQLTRIGFDDASSFLEEGLVVVKLSLQGAADAK